MKNSKDKSFIINGIDISANNDENHSSFRDIYYQQSQSTFLDPSSSNMLNLSFNPASSAFISFSNFQEDKTPLHIAAEKNSTDIAEILISKGADINAKDNINFSILVLFLINII